MAKKQIMYYHKIKTATDKGSVLYKTATDQKNNMENTSGKYNDVNKNDRG
jgi:hypothetical protein